MMVREAAASSPEQGHQCAVAVREVGAPLLVGITRVAPRITELLAPEGGAYSVATDRERGRIVFGSALKTGFIAPLVLHAPDGRPIRIAANPEDGGIGHYVCWTPDGRLVTSSHEGRIVVWSPALDRVTEVGRVDTAATRVEAAPAGAARVAVAGKPGAIVRLDSAEPSSNSAVNLEDVGDAIAAMAWSPDGTKVICGLRNGSLHVCDGTTGKRVGSLAPHERQICDIAWSADGRVLVAADAEVVRISDAATLSTYDELRPGWRIETMCLAADGTWLAFGGRAAVQNSDEQARLTILNLDPR